MSSEPSIEEEFTSFLKEASESETPITKNIKNNWVAADKYSTREELRTLFEALLPSPALAVNSLESMRQRPISVEQTQPVEMPAPGKTLKIGEKAFSYVTDEAGARHVDINGTRFRLYEPTDKGRGWQEQLAAVRASVDSHVSEPVIYAFTNGTIVIADNASTPQQMQEQYRAGLSDPLQATARYIDSHEHIVIGDTPYLKKGETVFISGAPTHVFEGSSEGTTQEVLKRAWDQCPADLPILVPVDGRYVVIDSQSAPEAQMGAYEKAHKTPAAAMDDYLGSSVSSTLEVITGKRRAVTTAGVGGA